MAYGLSGMAVVAEWLAATEEPDRRDALMVWLKAASIDPHMATSHRVERRIDGQVRGFFSVAVIERARCVVTFVAADAPIRALVIVRISDI
jgi:hypothetical protein